MYSFTGMLLLIITVLFLKWESLVSSKKKKKTTTAFWIKQSIHGRKQKFQDFFPPVFFGHDIFPGLLNTYIAVDTALDCPSCPPHFSSHHWFSSSRCNCACNCSVQLPLAGPAPRRSVTVLLLSDPLRGRLFLTLTAWHLSITWETMRIISHVFSPM